MPRVADQLVGVLTQPARKTELPRPVRSDGPGEFSPSGSVSLSRLSGNNAFVQFRVLGPIEALNGGQLLPLGGVRERLVLATLLLAEGRQVPMQRLIDLVWNEPPRTAKQQVHNAIAGLRRRLAPHDPELITTTPSGYALDAGQHTVDALQFRRLVGEARSAAIDDGPRAGIDLLHEALSLWRGEPLSESASSPQTDQLESARQGLREDRIAAVDQLVDLLAASGNHDEVLAMTATRLNEDPWHERLHAYRLRALASTGRRAEACEAYRALHRRFVDVLGLPPSAELVELNNRILDGSIQPCVGVDAHFVAGGS